MSFTGVSGAQFGTVLTSPTFGVDAGSNPLTFDVNFLTTDGSTTYSDFTYVELLQDGNVVATLFNANTTTANAQAVPAIGGPATQGHAISSGVSLSPSTAFFSGSATGPVGGKTYGPNKFGGGAGGGTGWITCSYSPQPGTYQLQFIVSDVGNRDFPSALAIDNIVFPRPQVKIEAIVDALEGGGQDGQFSIVRNGDLAQPLTVYFGLLESTATDGVDYVSLGSLYPEFNVTIPAQGTEVTIDVSAISDDLDEGDESVVVVLSPGPSPLQYNVDTNNDEATVWILEDPYPTDWTVATDCSKKCKIGGSDVSSDGDAGVSADELSYDSGVNPHPIVPINVTFDEDAEDADSIEAQLTFGGITGTSVFYDAPVVTAGTPYRFALMADATTLDTGFYNWSITITQHYASEPDVSRTYHGRMAIVNRIDSEFGNRWANTKVDRLYAQAGGVLLVMGSGGSAWFFDSGTGTFQRHSGEAGYSTLTFANGEYTLSDKFGATATFNGDGMLTSRTSAVGSATTYTYIDADNDSVDDELETNTDSSGHTTTYDYTGARVTSITDFAGRVRTLAYTSSRLTSITLPDPDDAGPLEAPVHTFTYDNATGLVESYTDPGGEITTLEYYPDRKVKKQIHSDNTYKEFKSSLFAGVVDTSVIGTENNPAPLLAAADARGFRTDELGHTTFFVTDQFGLLLEEEDAHGKVTTYKRDVEGRLVTLTEPDPDGAGSLPAPVTNYTYDAFGNTTEIEYPDGSTETWTYNTDFGQATSYTDRLGHVALYTLDNNTGLILEEQRVIGEPDGQGNSETNDLITSFTYTAAPTSGSDPPAGLIETMTDPLGRVTRYEYDNHGNVVSITYAEGTADEAEVQFEYDSADQQTASIDELGRRTEYAYDDLGRLTTMTLPDPDGSGSIASPVYEYAYDDYGRLVEETDPLERVTTYTYDSRGRQTLVTLPDPDGSGPLDAPEMSGTYDDNDWLVSMTDPLGRVTEYGYDSLGRQTSITLPDPDGNGTLTEPVVEMEYDHLGRVTSTTDALGNDTTYAYANFGRQVTTTFPDPDGSGQLASPVIVDTYDAAGNLVNHVDARGGETDYEFDDAGRLITVTQPDPDGSGPQDRPVTEYAYDKAGNLVSVTDPLGRVTSYVYDNRNRMIEMHQPDPDGGGPLTIATSYTYDAAGQLTSVTDPLGRVTSYEYDDLRRQITITQPDPDGSGSLTSPVTHYAYDAVSRLASLTDPLGNVITYAYDDLGRQINVTLPDPDGSGSLTAPVSYSAYDAASQLIQTTDAMGRTTSYAYDGLGRQITVTAPDPDGTGSLASPVTEFAYDANGNLTSMTDPLDHVTTYAYDNLNRNTAVTQPDPDGSGLLESPITAFTYDAAGNRLTLTDPNNNTTTWIYDFLNRVTGEVNYLNSSRTFEYDDAGRLTEKTDRVGRITRYDYNTVDQVIAEKWYESNGTTLVRTISYEYDEAGQMTGASDPAAAYDYVYDQLGRLTKETQDLPGLFVGHGFDMIYDSQYDANGNRTQLDADTGPLGDFKNTYQYDNLQRMTRLEQYSQGGWNVYYKRFDFTYNAAGQFEKITRFNFSGYPTLYSHYQYDGMGRVAQLTHSTSSTAPTSGFGSGALSGHAYTFDDASRITSRTSLWRTATNPQYQGTITYAYDNTNQLTGETRDWEDDSTYAYDDNGNRTEFTIGSSTTDYMIGDNNRVESDGTFDYAYDNEGNLTAKESATTRYEYDYDWRNRLEAVRLLTDSGSGFGQEWEVAYGYDVFDRMVRRSVDTGEPVDPPIDSLYSYENGQIVMAFERYGYQTQRFLWGPQTDLLLESEYYQGFYGGGYLYFPLADAQGTVHDAAYYDWQTQTTSVVMHREFDAFGREGAITTFAGAAYGWNQENTYDGSLFLYTGRYRDQLTGLQYNHHRWYNPDLGRWMSEDPIGFAAGDSNLSRYVGNSPTNATDPSGLDYQRIGSTIIDILMQSVIRGYMSFGVFNRIGRLFYDTYKLYDGNDEMQREFSVDINLYYISVVNSKAKAGLISSEWQSFSDPTRNLGQWSFDNRPTFGTGWWLGTAHRVTGKVEFEARCEAGRIEVRNLKSEFVWYDEIDGRDIFEWFQDKKEANFWQGAGFFDYVRAFGNLYLESIYWDWVQDKLLDSSFKVEVSWKNYMPFFTIP